MRNSKPSFARSPRLRIARCVFLVLLMLGLIESSALAAVCAIHDMDVPAESQLLVDSAFVGDADSSSAGADDQCCFFCNSSAGCGGACSHAPAPISAFPGLNSVETGIHQSRPMTVQFSQRIVSNLFRPPIAG